MQLEQAPNSSQFQIREVSEAGVLVNKTLIKQSFIISPTQLITTWRPHSSNTLEAQDMAPIIDLNPEIVLIGTGSKHQLLADSLFTTLISQHIGYEVMSTRAACRTYCALSSEDRNVVAAIIIDRESP